VKLLRSVLDLVAPHVVLITETNVPHEENISYFGDGTDEAQMVYQFPLPPLVLHSFHAGDATRLSEWAAGLEAPSTQTTFFNFLASHDGIGVRPAEGILSPVEIQHLVEKTLAHGGYVSYKAEADGGKSIYELNISLFDALSDPAAPEPIDLQIRRFMASQAILLSLAGVPGIYIHSLFGSRSYHAGVERTGHYRTINREKLSRSHFEQELSNPDSLRHQVFQSYKHLIRARTTHRAFHPNGFQQVILGHPALFVVLRKAPFEDETVLCVHNVSSSKQRFEADLKRLSFPHTGQLRDLITNTPFPLDTPEPVSLELSPYQVLWLVGERA
jgi:sucrose phosphorylase